MSFLEEAKKMKEEAKKDKIENKKDIELIEGIDEINNLSVRNTKKEQMLEELYQRTIRNIRISESERIRINKNDFTDKDEVIDILLYMVGALTQDDTFYKINIQKLKNHKPIYNKAE